MPNTKRLVVISPGLGLKTKDWDPLINALKEQPGWGDADTEFYRHESKTSAWGFKRLKYLAADLASRINGRWIAQGGYDEVVLIGHSMGGLVVRKAYLLARGRNRTEEPDMDWALAVKRIVLMAAPNRGLEKLPWFGRPYHWIHLRLRALHLFPHHTYDDILRGSAFVTNLRIGWIRLFGTGAGQDSLPTVVQLRGINDSIVSESDSTDLLVFPGATPIDVPGATHADLHRLDGLDPDLASERRALLLAAICDPEKLNLDSVTERIAPSSVKDVVFVLHGIRADRTDGWLSDVKREVISTFPPGTVVEIPTYGYLTARKFAVPSGRQRDLWVFQDAYTEALARHPSARFHFIGHSNGTYLLGQSLKEIDEMTFGNVVLAGSVLPPAYPWDEKLGRQVDRVRSDRGQGDWPVGWLCTALHHGLFMKDIGPGGYVGFKLGAVQEELPHPGGHGGMLGKDNIVRMVRFIRGEDPGPTLPTQAQDAPGFSRKARFLKYLVWLILLGLFAGGVWFHGSHGAEAMMRYIAAILIIGIVLFIGLDVI